MVQDNHISTIHNSDKILKCSGCGCLIQFNDLYYEVEDKNLCPECYDTQTGKKTVKKKYGKKVFG